MTLRNLNAPYWFMALCLFTWGLVLVRYSRRGRRMLDVGAGARSIPRFYMAGYYLTLWLVPGLLPSDVTHLMGRWGLAIIALSDIAWFAADEWLAAGAPRSVWAARLARWLRTRLPGSSAHG